MSLARYAPDRRKRRGMSTPIALHMASCSAHAVQAAVARAAQGVPHDQRRWMHACIDFRRPPEQKKVS